MSHSNAQVDNVLRNAFDTIASHSQYWSKCEECDTRLSINTPIMCYISKEGNDLSLCDNCYWECEYWKHDTNEDNKDEINECKKEEEGWCRYSVEENAMYVKC